MSAPIAYGIDFGTTNSLLSVAYPDRVDVVTIKGSPTMPSVAYLHRSGRRSAGEDAVAEYLVTGTASTRCGSCDLVDWSHRKPQTHCRQMAPGGSCNDSRLVAALKAFLTGKRSSTHSWAVDFSFSELIAVILERLKREADLAVGANVRRAVIGHPVVYPDAQGPGFVEKQQMALDRMKDAALAAGFSEVVFLEEPAAAVLGEPAVGTIVAVDFGGGTFDVAVMDMSPEGGTALALQGVAVGGEDFDAALFEGHLTEHLDIPTGLPGYLRESLRNLSGALFAIGRKELRAELMANRNSKIAKILHGGFAYHFYRAVEQAKIDLSASADTTIDFHRPGLDLSVGVSRSAFEMAIAPDLEAVFDQIERALAQADVAPEDVDLVVRTGGSSAIPAFNDGLASIFKPDRIEQRDAFATIVRGLGIHAQEVWR